MRQWVRGGISLWPVHSSSVIHLNDQTPTSLLLRRILPRALGHSLQVDVWDNNESKWDPRKGEWVPKGTRPLQKRIEGLSVRYDPPSVTDDGELKLPVATVTGALLCASLVGCRRACTRTQVLCAGDEHQRALHRAGY